MQRFRAIVEKLRDGQAQIVLEDGTRLLFPLDKLPDGICEGTFLRLSIGIDRIAAFLHKPEKQLVPKGIHCR